MQGFDKGQLTNWINNEAPEELIPVSKQILSRISTLPQEQRDRFTNEVVKDPSVSRLFERTTA